MTCREFKHTAQSLTLWELSRSGDKQVLEHAEACPQCGAWLDRQQTLAVEMQSLQEQTASREAGPHVERELLQVFRQANLKTQPVAALRPAPIAFRLSRFFELGSYAAVAAAVVVGLFLGVRLLEQRTVTAPVQSQSIPAVSTSPVQPVQIAANQTAQQPPIASLKREVAAHPVSQSRSNRRPSAAAASQSGDDSDYVALMFCDPLICSSEPLVVRMELPVAGTGDTQTQVADVVVGDDGLVRAMRIVN